MITREAAAKVIDHAIENVDKASMTDSARLCLEDACELFVRERYEDAHGRAMRSLCYSVGAEAAAVLVRA